MPFPNDEVTPPVTKMYLVMRISCNSAGFVPAPNVCVRDTKVGKKVELVVNVEKVRSVGKLS
jgi:hypothetical protein